MLQQQSAEPLLLSEKAAAKLLSLSVRSLFTMRQKGEIRFITIGKGKGIRYSRVDLVEWIARKSSESASQN